MAGKSNLKISVTTDEKQAVTGLKNLDDQVGKTGGGIGKMGKAAAVGGAAVVALGVASVLAFEDLGLTVGKFADATGATTEEASRLIEVAGDIGISSDTLSSSIGKMSKQLGANKDAFKEYGIEVQKNADGTTNINETFLASVDAINKIQDPLKKAEAAAKVFGKGYQEMGELLGQSSEQIRTSLAAVSDQKVFDDKKVQDARDMRAAFDSIVDAGQDLLLTIGSALAPVITKLAPILVKVVEAAAPAAEALGEVLVSALEVLGPILEALLPVIEKVAVALSVVADAIGLLKPGGATAAIKEFGAELGAAAEQAAAAGLSTDEYKKIVEEAAGAVTKTGDAQKDLGSVAANVTQRLDELTNSTKETDRETRRLGQANEELVEDIKPTVEVVDALTVSLAEADIAYRGLTGHLDEEDAWANVNQKMAEFKALIDPTGQDIRNMTRDVADYVAHTDTIPASKKTDIFAAIRDGDIAEMERLLLEVTRHRDIRIGLIGAGAATAAGFSDNDRFASGGIVSGPKGAPRPILAHGGEMVLTPEQQKAVGVGSGLTVNVFAAGHIATEGDIIRSVADGIIDAMARGVIPAGAFS